MVSHVNDYSVGKRPQRATSCVCQELLAGLWSSLPHAPACNVCLTARGFAWASAKLAGGGVPARPTPTPHALCRFTNPLTPAVNVGRRENV